MVFPAFALVGTSATAGNTLTEYETLRSVKATTVTGRVVDASTGETLVGVNIMVKGKVIGTSTNADGEFRLELRDNPPVTLIISIIGFQTQEIVITDTEVSDLVIEMETQPIFGSDVVVSASRVEQSILQAPVAIEKMDLLTIRETASTSFYEALSNLKGVDFSTQSLTFRSVNTRGFNANGNTRFVQLIDGIDNQAPGLNFSVGNIVGITELDLETAELIPGAASALYGPNAINGILLLNSKSPFDYQGLSFSLQSGVNHLDSEYEDPSLYEKYEFRYAKAYNDRFAIKVTGSYLSAQDFVGEDYRDQSGLLERGATSREEAALPRIYDGLNSYGDFLITVGTIADIGIASGNTSLLGIRSLIPDGLAGAFTPTGYREVDFVDNTTESIKLGTALHYRLNDYLELIGQFNTGYGSTVYTANDRFVLDDFNIWTAKLELRNPNFFLRAYTTQENSGDTYAANTVASLINQRTYLSPYLTAFAGARVNGATVEQAHGIARAYADELQPAAKSPEFMKLFNEIRGIPISQGGAKFLDKSDLFHFEGLYNFSNLIDPSKLEVIMGANLRRYALNSEGTLFALQDNGDEYNIDEWGAYMQVGKSLFDGNMALSGSLRYDKNEYFEGQFSPRASAVFTIAEDHNFRFSYQTGFRIPSTQDQFIDLDVVSRRLIGSNPDLVDRYKFETNTVYTAESVAAGRAILAGGGSVAAATAALQPFNFNEFQPEKISSYEIGYKTLIGNRLFIDAYYYFSRYTNFIAEVTFTQGIPNGLKNAPSSQYTVNNQAWRAAVLTGIDPVTGGSFRTQSYGFDINADGNVDSQGFAVTADMALTDGFSLGGNVSYNELISQDDLIAQGFNSQYNTPKWRYNVRFQNRNVTENFGFNMVYRWQDAYLWESSIGRGIVPAFGSVDAQISFKFPAQKTIVKFGGTNILNERYYTSLANPLMGSIYYITLTFDELLN